MLMRDPMPNVMKKYEYIGGLVWLAVYMSVLGLLIEGALLLFGVRDYSNATLNCVYFFTCFLVTAGLFHRFLADSLPVAWQNPGNFLKALVFGFCLYELMEIALSIGLEQLWPNYTTPNDDTVSAVAGESYAVMWVGAVLLAPLTEESLIRGLVFGGLRRKNRLVAYLVSSLLFALMHIIDYIPDMDMADILVNLLIYGLPGVALAACYEKARTIWGPIALHMIINALGMAAMNAAA